MRGRSRKFLCVILGLLNGSAGFLWAQVQVDISLKRSLYLLYEPLICVVRITNLSGADLMVSDGPEGAWFSLQVERAGGIPLVANGGGFSNEPMMIPAGGSLRRSINVTPLFPIYEFGSYRIRAVVYLAEYNRHFSSPQLSFEVTEGREVWSQTVGVPADLGLSGKRRRYSLLTHRLPNSTMLYVRVEDPDRGVVYCTTQLGRTLSYGSPDVMIAGRNELHILQNLSPKEYLHTEIGLDGKVQRQQAYRQMRDRPVLVRSTDGGVTVLGGTPYDPRATPPERELPGLGERPVPLPSPNESVAPAKDETRPRNLLSR